jgi:Delta3-Delta2-enoyl-CoA isomerase
LDLLHSHALLLCIPSTLLDGRAFAEFDWSIDACGLRQIAAKFQVESTWLIHEFFTESPSSWGVGPSFDKLAGMLLIHDRGNVREIQLNRQPVNALTAELMVGLRENIENAARDGVRAVVLSGTPGRFSAGLDVPLLLGLTAQEIAVLWRSLYALLQTIASSSVPIAAAITGHAPAGGTVLTLFCDWRVMADGDYKIGLNEVQVGIPLPPVILRGLRRLVGQRRAEQLGVSGALISPREALAVGLVDELAPLEDVVKRAEAWCTGLLALPRDAMKLTRQQARADLLGFFESGMDAELKGVIANWWAPETQQTLRGLVESLRKK